MKSDSDVDKAKFTKVHNYYNPTIVLSVDGEARLTTKEARQLAQNIIECADELDGKSSCGTRLVKGMEISTCRLKFWANPRFRV